MIVGMGLFSAMRISTPIGVLAVYQIVQGVGMGLLYSTYVRPFHSGYFLDSNETPLDSSP